MQLSSPRAQRLAVAFLVAVLVATVALLFVNAHRVAHAEAVSAPAAMPQRPPDRARGPVARTQAPSHGQRKSGSAATPCPRRIPLATGGAPTAPNVPRGERCERTGEAMADNQISSLCAWLTILRFLVSALIFGVCVIALFRGLYTPTFWGLILCAILLNRLLKCRHKGGPR